MTLSFTEAAGCHSSAARLDGSRHQTSPYVYVPGGSCQLLQAGCHGPAVCRPGKTCRCGKPTAIAVIDRASDSVTCLRHPNFATSSTGCSGSTFPLTGIFNPRNIIGHYTGLMHLGREAMGTQGVPVYAMPRMLEFLSGNGPGATTRQHRFGA